ncbi:MAG: helix-turn-helix domain-containing protein [Candidatus Pacebacteria bacterium]|nr:helix-turn-helix domain-containing protein [Candidatus Paceibacterota bacterium]
MFKKVPIKTKEEILLKIKEAATVAETAEQYEISVKTIYTWLRNQVKPDISVMKCNRLKRENDELKRIIGLITLELERGKKISIVKQSKNKRLIGKVMKVNVKNLHYQSKKEQKGLRVKKQSGQDVLNIISQAFVSTDWYL